MFSYKSKYFLQFLPIKNFINKKVNAHQMQENKIPFPFFVLSLEKYLHLSRYIHYLFICLFFTYVICYLQIVNMKKEKKNLRNCIFQSTSMHKIEPKKNQAAQKFTDHILVLSH